MNQNVNYSTYQSNQILDADQGKLILMMYDGAIQFTTHAKNKLKNNDLGGMGLYLGKAEGVMSELLSTLNNEKGGEISKSLTSLYSFIIKELLLANIKKDPKILEQIISILTKLRGAWHRIFTKKEEEKLNPLKMSEMGLDADCKLLNN